MQAKDLTRPGEFHVAERLRVQAAVALDKAQRAGGAGDAANLKAFFMQCLGAVIRACGAVPSTRNDTGTSVVTTGVTDSEGGTSAITITDNDGAAYEFSDWVKTFTAGTVRHGFHVRIKKGTASGQLTLLKLLCNGTGSRTESWTFDHYTGVFAQQNTGLSAAADTGLAVSATPDGLWWDVAVYILPASDSTQVTFSLYPAVKASAVPAVTDNASLVNTGSGTLTVEPPKYLAMVD